MSAIALATVAVLPPGQAMAATPPYTAFKLIAPHGSGSYDASNASIHAEDYGTDGFHLHMNTPNFEHFSDILFRPPTGTTITIGTTYPTQSSGPTATHGYMDGGADGRACGGFGFMTVRELTLVPGTTRPASIAVFLSLSCTASTQVFFADVRVNSSIGFSAMTPVPGELSFGEQVLGVQGPQRTVTLTASGAADTVLGAASIVDGDAFAITSDTCSNSTVAPGGTCTIGVKATATVLGMQGAMIRLPVNYGNGQLGIALTVTGFDAQRLAISPASLDFGRVVVGQTSAAKSTTLTATGISPVTLGSVALAGEFADAFGISGNTCSGVTLQVGQSCTIAVVAHPAVAWNMLATLNIPTNNLTNPASVPLTVTGEPDNAGTYYPLTPSRILDTREGNGAPKAPVGPGGSIHLQVAGRGGVPASGVSAVILNVTLAGPTAHGHITVWPTGLAKPTASSLNFVPGWTGANSVTIALGTGGQVDLFNSAGNTHLIADVVGYYAKDNSVVPTYGFGGEFQPVLQERLFDSRADWGVKLPGGEFLLLPVSYGTAWEPGFFNPHIRALAINVTAVDGAGPGYLTTFSGEGSPPLASTLNFTTTGSVPNFAVVPVSHCFDCEWPSELPVIGVYTSVDVHVIVDIIGFYDDGQLADGTHDGLRFTPQTPVRIADSRIGQGIPGALGPGSTVSVSAGSMSPWTWALALNVTAVSPTATTFVSIWPTGWDQPPISTLNPNQGQVVPNAVPVLLGIGDRFNVYNNAGSTHILVDMVGTFYFRPAMSMSGLGPSLAFKHADGDVPGASRSYASGLRHTTPKAQLRHP